jgi:hypothetical protein
MLLTLEGDSLVPDLEKVRAKRIEIRDGRRCVAAQLAASENPVDLFRIDEGKNDLAGGGRMKGYLFAEAERYAQEPDPIDLLPEGYVIALQEGDTD